MADSAPSLTARKVAAYRLGFERLAVPYGNAGDDDALARDVAGTDAGGESEGMAKYLRGRTSFFDRVIVNALGRGITQVVSVGAGYDGRSLRYAAPGVRWYEIDHPDTQSDKLDRLSQLGIEAEHVAFVAHDLRLAGLAAALVSSGYDQHAPSIMICEGVMVYLELSVVESMLADLRSLATSGTHLAVSLSSQSTTAGHVARRELFEQAVASVGEAVKNSISPEGAAELFASNGWRRVEISQKAGDAGFAVYAPAWVPSSDPERVSVPGGPRTETVRAFLPSKEFEESKAFYTALGFEKVLDSDVAIFRAGRSEFILTRFFQAEYAGNMMMQIQVDDLDDWWDRIESLDLAKRFGVRAPTAPAMQGWGLRVAFVVDPSGVLWHFVQSDER